jgi:hypothetical protein
MGFIVGEAVAGFDLTEKMVKNLSTEELQELHNLAVKSPGTLIRSMVTVLNSKIDKNT